jgi:hypothetical protein
VFPWSLCIPNLLSSHAQPEPMFALNHLPTIYPPIPYSMCNTHEVCLTAECCCRKIAYLELVTRATETAWPQNSDTQNPSDQFHLDFQTLLTPTSLQSCPIASLHLCRNSQLMASPCPSAKETLAQGGETLSALPVARITGVNHQRPAHYRCLIVLKLECFMYA